MDKLQALILEVRDQRASIPVGLTIVAAVLLWLIARWPDLMLRYHEVYSPALQRLFSAIGTSGAILALLLVALILGRWWCDLACKAVWLVQRAIILHLPLVEPPARWTAVKRLVCPVPTRVVIAAQTSIEATREYLDLEAVDKDGAHRGFLIESLRSPLITRSESMTLYDESVRSYTDLRLTSGLLLWLPLAIIAVSMHLQGPAVGLGFGFRVVALLSALLLLAATINHAWQYAAASVVHNMTAPVLTRHCRAAVNSGRSAAELRCAETSLD